MLTPLTLCAALSVFGELPGGPAQAEPFQLHPIEEQILAATNAERARYGLPPLAMDRHLMRSARAHAIWMTQNHSMQHTRQMVAENIAMGQPDCASVMASWMGSPGHRANILNASYRRIGVAAYAWPGGTVFWCQQFLW